MIWNRSVLSTYIVGFLLLMVVPGSAADRIEEINIPASQKKWVNGGPYSSGALTNKTVVFYFYEED